MLGKVLFLFAIFSVTSHAANADELIVRLGQSNQQHQQTAETLNSQGYVPVFVKDYSKNGALVLDQIWERAETRIEWDMRAQLTDAQFTSRDSEFVDAGYSRYCHSRYTLDGVTYHTAIWRKGQTGPERAIRIGESTGEHQRSADALANQGFIPVYVNGDASGNNIRLDQVWEKRSDRVGWDMRATLSDSQFELKERDLGDLGYSRIWHSRYRVDGRSYNAAIWHK